MKRIIFLIILMLSIALPAQAWESSVGFGWEHRHFSIEDQLGATSPTSSVKLISASGVRLSGSLLWKFSDTIKAGPELTLGNSWASALYQSDYYTKTAGNIDTNSLMVQAALVSAKIQVLDWRRHLLFLKPGFMVTNLTSAGDRVDADTGSVLGLEIANELGENNRISIDVQAIFSPSIRGKYEYDLTMGLVLSLQQLFRSKSDNQVSQLIKEEVIKNQVILPKKEEIKKQDPVQPPVDITPTAALQPIVVKKQVQQEGQNVKAVLKLGSDGKLSSESYPLIQKILDVYNTKPAIVKILHRETVETTRLAEEIKVWLAEKGVPKDDIQLNSSSELDKPIRINIVPR